MPNFQEIQQYSFKSSSIAWLELSSCHIDNEYSYVSTIVHVHLLHSHIAYLITFS